MKIQMLTAVLGLGVLSSHANVVITEYVEGGGSNKAIEIFNLGAEDIDLGAGGYKIDLYANGSTETSNGILLRGLLIPNSSIVVYNNGQQMPLNLMLLKVYQMPVLLILMVMMP